MSAPGITVARVCSACGQLKPCPPGAHSTPWRCDWCVSAGALTDSPTGAPPDWVHPSMVADEGETRRRVSDAAVRRYLAGQYPTYTPSEVDDLMGDGWLWESTRGMMADALAAVDASIAGGSRLQEVVAERDDMRARLEADAAAFVEQGRKLFDARLRTAEHAARLAEHAEAEAAVCPEDVGCIEYIGVLTRRVAALAAERDALARLAEDRRGRLLLCAELFARSPWPEMLDQARAIRAEHGRGR